MKRIVWLPLLLLLISAWLPFHSVNANESKTNATDDYQVELNFLSHEAEDTDVLFIKQATLTVKEDRYTLSISAKNDHILTHITAMQQGNKMSTRLNRAENLVQFDIKDVQQKIELTGTYRLAKEHAQQTFSSELLIEQQSLPAFDQKPTQSIQAGDDTIHYQLLLAGKLSEMNDYVNPVIRVIERDHRFYAQLEILHPSKVKGFTVEQQGNLVEPKVVSQTDTRIVQFEVEDFQKGIGVWMKAENPVSSHVEEEFLQIVFNQQQTAKFLRKEASNSKAVSSLTKRVEQPAKSTTAEKPSTVTKKDGKLDKSSEEKQPVQTDVPPLLTEEKLEFDRTVDDAKKQPDQVVAQVASEPEEVAMNEETDQTIPFDVLRIGVLLSLCMLSGILFLRRLTKKNSIISDK